MMRRFFTLLITLAVAAEAWAWKPLFVGHRGCNIGVENTAEAFLYTIFNDFQYYATKVV